jgi:flagellar motor switch protein FliG
MPDEQAAPKTLSIADALKEGVKGAQQTGTVTFDDLDGASKAAVILLAVGAESAANVLRQMTPFEVQRLSSCRCCASSKRLLAIMHRYRLIPILLCKIC